MLSRSVGKGRGRSKVGAGLACALLAVGCSGLSDARRAAIEASPQHDGKKFRNVLEGEPIQVGRAMSQWLSGQPNTVPEDSLPFFTLQAADFVEAPSTGLRITWVGHSTSIVEIDGYVILLDPIWSKRASPFSFMGPKRFVEPPIALEELPDIDLVVISHDHYDHLDKPTIKRFEKMRATDGGPKVKHYAVPLGVGQHLEDWGVPSERVTDRDWWQKLEFGELRVVATPARHASGRSIALTDRDETLWASWVLLGPEHRVFFSGDSALTPQFRQVGKRYGPFDAALVETGAYNALWRDIHMGPEQAVECHRMVRGGLYLPVHWGTFELALHGWTEPVERVIRAAHEAGVRLVIPRMGQQVEPASPPPFERWWPNVAWETARDAPVVSSRLQEE